jgi:SAM-dependent methyltransferase
MLDCIFWTFGDELFYLKFFLHLGPEERLLCRWKLFLLRCPLKFAVVLFSVVFQGKNAQETDCGPVHPPGHLILPSNIPRLCFLGFYIFLKGTPLRDASALARIVKASKVTSGDSVVDFGCGPGIVSCAFGAVAKKVVGIDITPKMIELAKAEAKSQNLENVVSFQLGDVYATEFKADSFDVSVSRFVLHHLEQPEKLLAEMRRVASKRVVIVDVTPVTK